MSDPTIFSNQNDQGGDPTNTSGVSNAGGAPNNDQFATLLLEIKNERGEPKYKTVQEALIGLKNAQEYIPTLKQTLTQREQELAAAQAKANEIEELKRVVQELTANKQEPITNSAPALSEQQVAELVGKALETQQSVAKQKENTGKVVETIKAEFGDKAEAVFYERAGQLGMSRDEINTLAAKSPAAVFQLLGIKQGTNSGFPTRSTVNSSGFVQKQDSYLGRNEKSALAFASTQDVLEESRASRALVDELHAQGKSVHDLTDPKIYNQIFGKK